MFLVCIVALVALGVDEWLDEVGGALYLQGCEERGVGQIAIVAGARANVAESVGHAAVIRFGDEALLGSASKWPGRPPCVMKKW